ncbi:hypothetical protein GQ457_01G004120 [Hibiscus cannabinus]
MENQMKLEAKLFLRVAALLAFKAINIRLPMMHPLSNVWQARKYKAGTMEEILSRTQQREEAGVKPGRFLVNTVEGECETISRPSIVWSGKRKLGLQLDRAMDSDEAMGGEGSFSAHSPKEDSRQTGKQTGERDGYSGFDETQFAI